MSLRGVHFSPPLYKGLGSRCRAKRRPTLRVGTPTGSGGVKAGSRQPPRFPLHCPPAADASGACLLGKEGSVQGSSLPLVEQKYQHNPCCEASYVRVPGYASSRSDIENLRQEPDAEEDNRRNLHHLHEEEEKQERQNLRPRIEHDIRAEYPRYGAARAYKRYGGVRVKGDVSHACRDARKKIKDYEFDFAEPVFYVVAEYPEKQHIPEDVKKSAVHEHGGKKRERRRKKVCRRDVLKAHNLVRNGRCLEYEDFFYLRAEDCLKDENRRVNRYQGDGRVRSLANGVVVL